MNLISPSSEEQEIAGHKLMWHRWHPVDTECKGAFFFLHGLGDYGQRYSEIADVFLKEGIAFTICDLPGHGLSHGKRGHVPSWEIVKKISEQGIKEAKALAPNKPIGFGGHSMGGLLALFLLGEFHKPPDFCWISSPLLKPEATKSNWKLHLLRYLSHLFPTLTVSTEVKTEMCRQSTDSTQAEHLSQFHRRISFSWVRLILEMAEVVRTQPERLPSSFPILMTQGKNDPVCPSQFCEELVARLQRKDLKLILYPKARHEPFADTCKEQVFADLREWLKQSL